MEAQQIRLNINELANGIEDEALLNACFEAMKGITQAYRKLSGQPNGATAKNGSQAKAHPALAATGQPAPKSEAENERSLPHDLSLVLLANEIFKGSEPLPEAGEIAFERAFLKSLKTQPTLPNRL